ncbi:Histone-lysine N-methyltransferase family member protein [Actinidia chinensis var. chinensis]|uniref:Histone-lysine N-methyltransferase family member protein n=1 Tax=Actinidia chinensis var. chinensis TaxID=1590841 RepID=A0A2R6R8N8_ACTCC|nr:Histone-lysine N-methyltransferase family member protein [Actinidia chinensis var. chinensis]
MGSIVPLQDLNFFPDPTAAAAAATTTTTASSAANTAIKIPKLEPKLEPWDEPHISSPIPNFTESNPNYSEENNVYSEFYRVSELFRTAFAKTNGDTEVSNPDSRAIVPVPEENSHHQVSATVEPPRQRRSHQHRSSELVRVTDLGAEDQRYFRDVVRKTRMLYDSLRVFAEEKRRSLGLERRNRGDLRAASVLRDRGLWLNRDKRIVGSIPGVYIADLFFFRMELCVVGLHGQAQAGIDYVPAGHSSSGEPIATSVIVSGGYEDDEDGGEVIIYSGHGGQDKHSKQCTNQKLEGGNLALERSMYYGIEVRVIRGLKYDGSPSGKVYVYDGLYKIFESWFDVGRSGFGVFKYKLVRMGNQPEMGSAVLRFARSLRTEPLSIRPVGYLSLDISMNKENVPVGLFNDIDSNHEPIYYEYIVTTVFPPYAYHGANGNGCDCVSGCMDDCVCAMKNGGEFAYDLRAASVLRDRGLWLNRDKRIVGSIPGVYIADLFFFRMELCVVGLHGQAQAGIDYVPAGHSSSGEPIATSVIVSGGYEDDEDGGEVIIYSGHGGQDKHSKQCTNQKLEGGNLALERSMYYGIEVRVMRGLKYDGSPSGKVYVYDGLYKIFESWFDVGRSGFGVFKYKLVRMGNQPEMGSAVLRFARSLRTEPLSIRPVGYLSLDISMNKENVPVGLFNDIDSNHEPIYYEYIVTTVFPPYAYHGANGNGCDCVSGCMDDCVCAMKNGGEFAYDQNGLLVRGKPLIFECGANCRCPPSCRNRVSQNGVRNRFEVFRSRETGWGVRSLDLIQAGAFICEYAGVVLTREQAQLFTMNGDSLVYPNRFAERWAEWGDLSHIFSDYVRPAHPSIPPLDFAMDVSRMRNVACYISQSSSPNILVQLVLYDHNNLMFPHLMLFAMENIPPLRELSLDYGVADEWTGKLRICS